MDIIASHQQGLFERLQVEADALAGRPRDAGQRAIVYHHLADVLGLAHSYALIAAGATLAIDRRSSECGGRCGGRGGGWGARGARDCWRASIVLAMRFERSTGSAVRDCC